MNIDTPKTAIQMNVFRIGDTLRVGAGIVGPDDTTTGFGHWCGRTKDIFDDGIALFAWDSDTIHDIKIEQINKHENDLFGINAMRAFGN